MLIQLLPRPSRGVRVASLARVDQRGYGYQSSSAITGSSARTQCVPASLTVILTFEGLKNKLILCLNGLFPFLRWLVFFPKSTLLHRMLTCAEYTDKIRERNNLVENKRSILIITYWVAAEARTCDVSHDTGPVTTTFKLWFKGTPPPHQGF